MEKKRFVLWSLLVLMVTVATHGQAYSISSGSAVVDGSERPAKVQKTAVDSQPANQPGQAGAVAGEDRATETAKADVADDEEGSAAQGNRDHEQMAAGVFNGPEPIALLILGFAGIVLTRMRISGSYSKPPGAL